MDRSAGSNGAAASIRAQDITATRLLFFKSMIASVGLVDITSLMTH